MSDKLNAPNWNLLKLQRYQQMGDDSLVRLGTETWESARFKGTLYDHDTPIDEFLGMYAAQFDTVEYQATFFDIPSERRMEELRKKVEGINNDFRFCPVVPRRISHEFEWGENPYDMEEFISSMKVLGNHLGPCILRLPETFAPEMWQKIFRFFKLWPSDWPLALHLTHAEWFRKIPVWKNLLKEIQGSRFSILIEDKMEWELHPEKFLTSDHLVVRFFGRASLGQDDQRMAMWIYKLGEFRGYGVKHSYFFLREQEEMCLSMLRKMARETGGRTRVPESFDVNSKQLGFKF